MVTVLSVITSVSSSPLNDQEVGHPFTRWSIGDLTDYLNQGLMEISNHRPDAFMVTQEISLSTGSRQYVPGRLLKSIDAMGASSAFPGEPITQCDLELMRTFNKPVCSPAEPDNYRVMSYAYDVKNPSVFYVSPPVPYNLFPPVVATWVAEPPEYVWNGNTNNPAWTPFLNVDISSVYITALKFFMAAKAFEVDTESTKSQEESLGLYKKFYNSLGIKFSQETKYNSGMFAGQGGDNQMTKARVP